MTRVELKPFITPYLTDATTVPSPPAKPERSSGSSSTTRKASDAQTMIRWLRDLRERQGGVSSKFPSTTKRRTIRRSLADSCSGVSRHLAARAVGLFRADRRYRGEAERFRQEITQLRKSYPKLSRRLSPRAFAKRLAASPWHRAHSALLDRLQSTQSMLSKRRIQHYNREVLPAQLRRIGTAKGQTAKVEFHTFTDHTRSRKALLAALDKGAPVVVGLSAYYRGRPTARHPKPIPKWHNNCHYVVAIKIPGKKRVMIIDPWPGAKGGGVSFQRLSRLRMPGSYGSARIRLGTRFGLFRDATTKRPLMVKPQMPINKDPVK